MDHSGIRTSARRRKGSVANNNASVGAEKENDQVYETNRMEIDSEEAHPPQHKLDTAALKQHSYASDSSGSSEPESDDDDDDENFEISVSPSKPSHSVTRLPRKQQSIQALDSDSLTSGQLIYGIKKVLWTLV